MVAYISVNHWLQGRGSIRGRCFGVQAIVPVALDLSRYKQFRAELYKAISDDKNLLITFGQKCDAKNMTQNQFLSYNKFYFHKTHSGYFKSQKISKSKILQQIHHST